ncbi:MAG: ArsR/SmtB family transcription factor [Cyanobium sp.]
MNQEADPVDSAVIQSPDHVEPLASDQALALLRALADPIRLQVVQALAQGEHCVCELTSELALAQPKLSFHLKVLRQAGLLSARQQGRWIYYRLEPDPLLSLAGWLRLPAARCGHPAADCP